MTYQIFYSGADEFGEEYEIRCEVVDASPDEDGKDLKRWFNGDRELHPMGHNKLFHPLTGAIITLRQPF